MDAAMDAGPQAASDGTGVPDDSRVPESGKTCELRADSEMDAGTQAAGSVAFASVVSAAISKAISEEGRKELVANSGAGCSLGSAANEDARGSAAGNVAAAPTFSSSDTPTHRACGSNIVCCLGCMGGAEGLAAAGSSAGTTQ